MSGVMDVGFIQDLAKAVVQAAVPTAMLIVGGQWVMNRHDISRKKREQEIELMRFIRERQYDIIQDLYTLFADFMELYRVINSPETELNDTPVRRDILKQCASAEARIDATILRVASEFYHDDQDTLEGYLANLRQSVQIWRETVREGQALPFTHSDQEDYVRFKDAFSHDVPCSPSL